MKKLLLTLLLVVSLGAVSAFAAEASYTITFKSNSTDATNVLSADKYSEQIETGANFISGLSGSVERVYQGKSGLKFGSSKGGGTITFNLVAAAQVVPTNIIVSYAQYSSDATGLTVNGLNAEAESGTAGVYSYIPTSTEKITFLRLSSTKRIYVKSITVYYNDGEEVVKKDVEGKPYDDLTLEVDDYGTFASSIADFESGVTNLVLESSDEEGLYIEGLGYMAMSEGSYTVTVTWEEGSIYKANTSSFNVTVKAPAPKFKFNVATDKATLGELYTLPELTNTYDVKEYTLASSNEAVAVLSPVDGKTLWIVGEGTTTITATLAGQEGVTASYELTVSAPAALVEDAVTFNFNVEEAYGMTATDNGNFYLDDNFSFNEGEVKISIEKNGGSGARLWKNKNGTEFELSILKTSKLTISVPTGYITRVEFTEGAAHTTPKFSFSQLSGASMTWTPAATEKVTAVSFSGTDRSDIASIKVIYATEKEVSITTPDLKFSKLIAFGDMATIKGTATAGEATVGYLAGEGAEIEADGDNWIVSADETGEYDVTAYVAPAEGVVPAVKHGKLIVKPFPEKVYMIGHYYDRYYDITTPIVLTHQGNGKYTHTDKYILLGGSADEGDFGVVFTTSTLAGPSTEVAERRKVQEHATDWAALTDGEVIHAGGIYSADEITAASDLTSFVPTTGGGKYVISLDLANSAPTFETYSGVETGIEDVTVEQCEATYYDLTGRRVANPAAGAYIRVQGGKAQKVMFK